MDGLSGYECIGTGIHRKSDQESFIYQVMLFEGSSHWNLTGIAREKDRDQYLPVFRRMARSFQRKFETISSADGRTSMEVPKTWTLRAGIDEDADLQAGQAIAETYVIVLSEAKADADEGTTFDLYTQRCRDDFTADALSVGDVETIEINGLQGTKLPFRMGEEDTPLTFVHATLEGKDSYHQIVLWCLSS
ncbi:MAG: hypothetical protein P1V35_17075, partial [Planctomycetota bacterium]|nr:hypothetical protein [Planctomycetota bacterium]